MKLKKKYVILMFFSLDILEQKAGIIKLKNENIMKSQWANIIIKIKNGKLMFLCYTIYGPCSILGEDKKIILTFVKKEWKVIDSWKKRENYGAPVIKNKNFCLHRDLNQDHKKYNIKTLIFYFLF